MTAKFLIAPTYMVGKNYLRSRDRNPREWRILTGQIDDSQRLRGLTEAEIEYIPSSVYSNHETIAELFDVIAHRGLEYKEVYY